MVQGHAQRIRWGMKEEMYCRECGCQSGFLYLARYANGEEWRCPRCNREFMWDDEGDEATTITVTDAQP